MIPSRTRFGAMALGLAILMSTAPSPLLAQQVNRQGTGGGSGGGGGPVTCNGQACALAVNQTPFTPSTIGTPITATTGGASGTLPAGTTSLVLDVGSNSAYCQLGGSTAGIANSKLIGPGGQWAIYGASGSITCEGVGGTTTINLLGGSGTAVDTAGSPTVSVSNASVGATGSAVPGNSTYVGMNVGGNLSGLIGTANGLKVDGSAVTQPISGTITANLGTLNGAATQTTSAAILSALGSPFQAGGSIGNTSFGISGTLPAFASTPTMNLGTIGGAATQTTLSSVLSTLGSPFQAGGSIGNTAFGISGTLPAFASTPTVNLGTIGGAATQTTLSAIQTALGSPLQAGGAVVASGTASNASSGVATSSSNVPGIAFNYGFNGSTWDPLQVDGSKYLKIDCVTGCSSSGGSSQADNSAFTPGTTSFTSVGGLYQSSISNLTSGNVGAAALTIDRNLFVNLAKVGGTALAAPASYGTAPTGNALSANAAIQGAATTSPPSYSNGTQANISLDTAGNTRTIDQGSINAITAGQCTQPCPVAIHSNNVAFDNFGSPGGAVFSGTGTLIIAQAINLSDWKCTNITAGAEHYLVAYNSATVGAVTVGTTAPAVVLFCPPGDGTTKGYNQEIYAGAKFTAGLVVFALDNPGTGAGAGVTMAGGGDYTLGN